jgi:hypothetical protein
MPNPVRLAPAWQQNDAKLTAVAIEFWRHFGALPASVTPEDRVKELCAVAYVGDEVVGVSTIELQHAPRLRCRLGFFRCFVSPQQAHRRIARRLTVCSRELLEQWSKENPQEKILGMATILTNPNFDLLARRPKWGDAKLWLIGYTAKGEQIRLTWFDHARLDTA